MTVTRGVSGRDHLLWLHYRANVYSIMSDTPKTTGKFAETVTPSDSCHIPAIPVTKIVLGAVVAMTVTDSCNLLSMVSLIKDALRSFLSCPFDGLPEGAAARASLSAGPVEQGPR